MPAPRWLARANRRVTNQLLGPLVARLPGFAIVEHVGRRSGRVYRTPVNVFRHDGYVVIALTYGCESAWARNVLAAGGCALTMRGRTRRLTRPRLVHDETRRLVPAPVRVPLRLLQVSDVLVLDDTGEPPAER